MKITFDEFRQLAQKIAKLKEDNDRYLDSIPTDIKSFIFDNTYIENELIQNSIALKLLLGDNLYDDFQWFLWDNSRSNKENGDEPNIIINSDKIESLKRYYYIHNLETYLEYVYIEYFIPESKSKD